MPYRVLLSLTLAAVLVLAVHPAAHAQDGGDPSSTEARLHQLRQQISADERRLSEATRAEEASLQTLQGLDRELAMRRELATTYERRIEELTYQSDSLQRAMGHIEERYAGMKDQYRRYALHAYKYGRLHDLALILSASSINQMLIRVRYLNRFADQRKKRLESVNAAAAALELRRKELQKAKVETETLLRQAEDEKRRMAGLQQDRQRVVQHLRTERDGLEQDLEQKRTAATDLQSRVRTIVKAETARRAQEPSSAQAEVKFVKLTGSFLQNRGLLPWPASGVVVEPFGELRNPVYGTTTPNPGVLIATNPQAEVRSVFDGVILSVSVLPEFGTYVAIQHGEYQTVYSNFSMVYVTEGAQVKAGQVIGRAGTDAEPKQAGLFFGVFQNGAPLDPASWLQAR